MLQLETRGMINGILWQKINTLIRYLLNPFNYSIMGYDLHITRRTHWCEKDDNVEDITLSEWLSYIDADPELESSEDYWVTVHGYKPGTGPKPGFCDWIAHPLNESPWLSYSDGCISTKNPDDPTVRKMLAIAATLNAKVLGDDEEMYVISRTNEVVVGPLRYGDNDDPYADNNRPWWKFW